MFSAYPHSVTSLLPRVWKVKAEKELEKKEKERGANRNDYDVWACDSLYRFKQDMKTMYEWEFSIGQIRAYLRSKPYNFWGYFREWVSTINKEEALKSCCRHSPALERPASQSKHSPALLGCCLAGAPQEPRWTETRSLVVARFPFPLLRMAKSANSQGHCKGRLRERNCPLNVPGVPECFNSWESVSELLEDRNQVFFHQDFYKPLLSFDASTNQISIKAEKVWNVRKKKKTPESYLLWYFSKSSSEYLFQNQLVLLEKADSWDHPRPTESVAWNPHWTNTTGAYNAG